MRGEYIKVNTIIDSVPGLCNEIAKSIARKKAIEKLMRIDNPEITDAEVQNRMARVMKIITPHASVGDSVESAGDSVESAGADASVGDSVKSAGADASDNARIKYLEQHAANLKNAAQDLKDTTENFQRQLRQLDGLSGCQRNAIEDLQEINGSNYNMSGISKFLVAVVALTGLFKIMSSRSDQRRRNGLDLGGFPL